MEKQPAQHQQRQPGIEAIMTPQPEYLSSSYKGSEKLQGKIALITGGDSGIGRAVACAFAMEGADLVVHYLNEQQDAEKTKKIIENTGQSCLLLAANLQNYTACDEVVRQTMERYGRLDILVNNVAEQHPQDTMEEISCEQMENTFKTNFFSYFYMIKAALPFLKKGSVIINTTSVTAYKGSEHLIDYSATKGAILALTRSLSQNLVSRGIRVNAVAPGPIWTPLIPSSFNEEEVQEFGSQVPMKRAGQPAEVAPAYVFLASNDSSYMTGQVIHPNGGVIVNG
ncbi:KR domain-containing protein [Legionella taurinensis]|uniref:KR domain-containing protein n=1 Tax=Legionella taurinensis TaxID=70611 RepID=A0A3A5L829_9GAMM|nr:SDR family oxidoreductase [Legionella taurinensis]MDX1836757.1 SDR family oxidoreductase [Legionella taurinensis]PUT41180.1 NAD(P)-dependent oxidoreductase [Legionella taurinensis]PUT42305.1 NAD(P)-dependent oxidoreductase [Legionella taurinensis]PUT43830.1 NAD(P)-dependent oxidoreductase [Legionella taurinensis]PUT47086.1 NAD(P)-dependent oxidoreductase [Legionella taurinensis]